MINVNVIVRNVKRLCEKDYFWNHATCNCENRKNLPSIMDDSAITYDGNIE